VARSVSDEAIDRSACCAMDCFACTRNDGGNAETSSFRGAKRSGASPESIPPRSLRPNGFRVRAHARPGMTRERPAARRLAAKWHDGQDCASHRPQISGLRSAVPFRQEGRIAIVTNAGWDVVDARASARQGVAGLVLKEPVSDTEGAQRRTTFRAYGKTVWS